MPFEGEFSKDKANHMFQVRDGNHMVHGAPRIRYAPPGVPTSTSNSDRRDCCDGQGRRKCGLCEPPSNLLNVKQENWHLGGTVLLSKANTWVGEKADIK